MRKKQVIPVLLGDAIPQPDGAEEEYEKYCRCMMMLFTPWRDLRCLKGEHRTWIEAFEQETFSPAKTAIIRNMNVEKECKEARDAHAHAAQEQCIKPHVFDRNDTEYDDGQIDMAAFDQALFADSSLDPEDDDLSAINGESKSLIPGDVSKNAGDIQTCLRAAKDGGLFEVVRSFPSANSECDATMTELLTDQNRGRVKEFTSIMKTAKKRKRPIDVGSTDAEVKRARMDFTEDDPTISLEQMEKDADITSIYYKPEITDSQKECILTDIIQEFKLSDNAEQEMCLRIIGEHFIHGNIKQLLMFITGIGGSGKSHVIRATVEMFRRCGAPEKLTLSAPTGSAAVLIDGYTIHALTFLPKREVPVKQHDLEYIWRTIEYLILDEASLLSAELLSQVSHRICQAKSWDETARDKPFGGVNVIFAGDLGQLRPPMSNALYSFKLVDKLGPGTIQTVKGQSALHGAFLWCQIDVVVELKQNWRARDDAAFVEMLNRIRLGKVRKIAIDRHNASDYDVLKTRLLPEIQGRSKDEFESFKDAPIIVTRKYLRDAINQSKACAFATQTGQEHHVYHAKDRISGNSLAIDQQERLWKMDTTHTNDSPGILPLISGMPIMVTENAATSCKIVNGSRGILKSIVYEIDEASNRFPVYALVEIKESTLHVAGLDDGIIPIFPITSSFTFCMGEKTVIIRRTQLPILPGWAFTDYKVQGSELSKVIVDLTNARTLQSIYVMLSCASKLRNVAILRWFSSRTLHADLQGDARNELQRLVNIATSTRTKYLQEHTSGMSPTLMPVS